MQMAKWLIDVSGIDSLRIPGITGNLKDYSFKVDLDQKQLHNILLTRINQAYSVGNAALHRGSLL